MENIINLALRHKYIAIIIISVITLFAGNLYLKSNDLEFSLTKKNTETSAETDTTNEKITENIKTDETENIEQTTDKYTDEDQTEMFNLLVVKNKELRTKLEAN